MDDVKIRELIDACRAESADIDTDEMSQLKELLRDNDDVRQRYDFVQTFDAALRQSLPQIPVPAGLAERIQRSVLQANAEASALDVSECVETTVQTGRYFRASFGRRAALVGLLVAAAAVTAIFVPSWFFSRPRTAKDLCKLAVEWAEDARIEESWKDMSSAPPPDYPVSPRVADRRTAWATWKSRSGVKGVVYRLSRDGQKPTWLLFVCRASKRIDGLGTIPSSKPHTDTAGWSAGAWHERGRTYVLVVSGGRADYRRAIHAIRPPQMLAATPEGSTLGLPTFLPRHLRACLGGAVFATR